MPPKNRGRKPISAALIKDMLRCCRPHERKEVRFMLDVMNEMLFMQQEQLQTIDMINQAIEKLKLKKAKRSP